MQPAELVHYYDHCDEQKIESCRDKAVVDLTPAFPERSSDDKANKWRQAPAAAAARKDAEYARDRNADTRQTTELSEHRHRLHRTQHKQVN